MDSRLVLASSKRTPMGVFIRHSSAENFFRPTRIGNGLVTKYFLPSGSKFYQLVSVMLSRNPFKCKFWKEKSSEIKQTFAHCYERDFYTLMHFYFAWYKSKEVYNIASTQFAYSTSNSQYSIIKKYTIISYTHDALLIFFYIVKAQRKHFFFVSKGTLTLKKVFFCWNFYKRIFRNFANVEAYCCIYTQYMCMHMNEQQNIVTLHHI